MGEQILNFSETFGKRGHSRADDVWSVLSWPSEHTYLKISSAWLSGRMAQRSVLNFEHMVLSPQLRHGWAVRAELNWGFRGIFRWGCSAPAKPVHALMHTPTYAQHPCESLWQHLDVHILVSRFLGSCYKCIFPTSRVYSHTSYAFVLLWTKPQYFFVYNKKNV